jgi:protein involved in polysaccharide export with SLBB domain
MPASPQRLLGAALLAFTHMAAVAVDPLRLPSQPALAAPPPPPSANPTMSAVGITPATLAIQHTGQLEPFGASLFTGAASGAASGPNPNYRIQIGDQVSIRLWGGVNADVNTAVDAQGNVFVPNVGAIRVAGVRAGDLQGAVRSRIGSVYTENVQVYAAIQQTHQVGVFVTGFVRSPGRHLGAGSDSVLDYLMRAGGVDPARGSYRDIRLQRRGQTLATVDLYEFLLKGVLPPVNLQEGDAIVVARQYPMMAAGGAVRNNYLFELREPASAGKEIGELARPLPSATDVFVRGTRAGNPYAAYMTLAELARTPLYDQDQVTFITDAPASTVSAQIQGSRIGPSMVVADRDVTLPELLDYVAVNPRLADTGNVYILRPSVAQMQERALKEALDRLEKSLFYAISVTTGEAQIRASEAQLIASYIQRAREFRPEGRVVVVDDDGRVARIRPQDNDVIVIPEKSETVMVAGEVMAPQAVVYDPNFTARDYVLRAGGTTERGRSGNQMIRRASGLIVLDADAALKPGDELIVLPYIDTKSFQLVKDFVQVLYEIAAAGYFGRNL